MSNVTFTPATARAILRESGVEVGARGRLSTEQVAQALSLRPSTARALAAQVGVTLAVRGRISAANFAAIASAVA